MTEIRFTLPAREVRQALYAQRLSLSDGQRGTFGVTCLIAREIAPPPGVKPIEWCVLTNRTAETLEVVAELIDWYRARWEIERLFLVLKEGCRVEALQLAPMERLERALGLFLMVAFPLARLMRLGRTVPNLDARPFCSNPRSGRPLTSSPRSPFQNNPRASTWSCA